MKRLICLLMCLTTMLFVCACNQDTPDPSDKPSQTEPASKETQEPTAAKAGVNAELKAFMAKFDDTPTVGDKLLYENDRLTVSVHGINYAPTAGPELHLTIENRTDTDFTVQAPFLVVNGYMITPSLGIDVPAGKSANGNLTLPYFKLALAEITCIREMEFTLRAVETKTYNPLFTTDTITLQTSAATKKGAEQPEPKGQTVYDKGGVTIVIKGLNTDRAFSDGAELVVYMQNATKRSVTVQTEDVIVNGYDMTSAMNRTVLSEKRAVDVVTFYAMDMDEYGIDEIDSVKISFTLKDADNWETLDVTDLISVKLPEKPTEKPTEALTDPSSKAE